MLTYGLIKQVLIKTNKHKQMKSYLATIILFALTLGAFSACKKEKDTEVTPKSTFAKGADISWITQMEATGVKFYSSAGVETECVKLMKSLGMNSIRLRVWVNPTDGWCNKEDLLVKAIRANNLGMRIMIDFHYSDKWADPGQQTKPAQWQSYTMEQLKSAVSSHTKEVLSLLKSNGIPVEWVQVGNETGNGMLWEEGKASTNMANYAALNNAGYDAVKAIYPNAKVIVHIQEGNKNSLFRWIFDGLKSNNAKWDVIGMSLYPQADTWQKLNADCLSNINDMVARYGCEVMICEVGMPWNQPNESKAFLSDIIAKAKSVANGKCLGVFYWEPQSYNGWNGYQLGAFDGTGKPTAALDAFK